MASPVNSVTSCNSPISKELLKELTGCQVLHYSIRGGSKPGDNYMSVMYSVDLLTTNGESKELLFKCYPSHPSRQTFLNKTNMFYNEQSFYKIYSKELENFQLKYLKSALTPAIPPYIGGRTIDFKKDHCEKNLSPLDNFIVMTDLRSCGYKMFHDKKAGLDFAHLSLALTELAKLHALSWAYKQKVERNIVDAFPFLKVTFDPEDMLMWGNILRCNLELAVKAVGAQIGKDHEISLAVAEFSKHLETVHRKCFFQEGDDQEFWKTHRNPPPEVESEEPWRVILHGDCWMNNFLFKYNEAVPQSVYILDFQLAREGCPSVDLACLIYSSTNASFRKENLTPLLNLYYEKFNSFCNHLQVPSLPGFTSESLRRRFHRAKPIGFILALTIYPNIFLEGEQTNLEETEENSCEKMFQSAFSAGNESVLYKEKILELVKELYEDGVI